MFLYSRTSFIDRCVHPPSWVLLHCCAQWCLVFPQWWEAWWWSTSIFAKTYISTILYIACSNCITPKSKDSVTSSRVIAKSCDITKNCSGAITSAACSSLTQTAESTTGRFRFRMPQLLVQYFFFFDTQSIKIFFDRIKCHEREWFVVTHHFLFQGLK